MEAKKIKLSPKRGNYNKITSYTVNIGSAEARLCGFTKEGAEIEKIVDIDNNQIIIRLKQKT